MKVSTQQLFSVAIVSTVAFFTTGCDKRKKEEIAESDFAKKWFVSSEEVNEVLGEYMTEMPVFQYILSQEDGKEKWEQMTKKEEGQKQSVKEQLEENFPQVKGFLSAPVLNHFMKHPKRTTRLLYTFFNYTPTCLLRGPPRDPFNQETRIHFDAESDDHKMKEEYKKQLKDEYNLPDDQWPVQELEGKLPVDSDERKLVDVLPVAFLMEVKKLFGKFKYHCYHNATVEVKEWWRGKKSSWYNRNDLSEEDARKECEKAEAELVEAITTKAAEELKTAGISVMPYADQFGNWKGNPEL